MSGNNYAAQWDRLLAERSAPPPTAEIEIDGFKFVGRRVDLNAWIRGGRLPQALVHQVLKMERNQAADVDARDLTPDEISASIAFQREIVCASVVEPKLVTHNRALEEGEIRYSEILERCPGLVEKIYQWIWQGCPGIPVETKGGEVEVSDLNSFRPKRSLPRAGKGRRAVRKTAQSTAQAE